VLEVHPVSEVHGFTDHLVRQLAHGTAAVGRLLADTGRELLDTLHRTAELLVPLWTRPKRPVQPRHRLIENPKTHHAHSLAGDR
jgi:hypothetical protein